MSGAVPLLPLYATMVWTEESFTSVFLSLHIATYSLFCDNFHLKL
jgi:hypothetical protein